MNSKVPDPKWPLAREYSSQVGHKTPATKIYLKNKKTKPNWGICIENDIILSDPENIFWQPKGKIN